MQDSHCERHAMNYYLHYTVHNPSTGMHVVNLVSKNTYITIWWEQAVKDRSLVLFPNHWGEDGFWRHKKFHLGTQHELEKYYYQHFDQIKKECLNLIVKNIL